MSTGKHVAVVTGSNKGIGFAIVKGLCQKFNGDVYLTSRDVARGEEAVKALNQLGLQPKFHQLDIGDISSITKLKDDLENEYGGIDVLVNNAGIAYKGSSTASVVEQAQNTVKTNYFDTLSVCKTLFPILKQHARVVNVSSSEGMLSTVTSKALQQEFLDENLDVDGLCKLMNRYLDDVKSGTHLSNGWPATTYRASKVALTALTRIQQRNFDRDSKDIIVNAVHPGYVDTDMTSHKGPLTAEEGAEAPIYLALLEPNSKEPKGQMIWNDKRIVNWLR